MTYFKSVNPFKKTIWNSHLVKTLENKKYLYFAFNNFGTINLNSLMPNLFSKNLNMDYKLVLDRETSNETYNKMSEIIKKHISREHSETAKTGESVLDATMKFTKSVMQYFDMTNKYSDIELQELINKREQVRQEKSANTVMSVIIRVELESVDKKYVNNIIEDIELLANRLGINVQHMAYCQKELHDAFIGRKEISKHLQFSSNNQEVCQLNPIYYPTTQTKQGYFLGLSLNKEIVIKHIDYKKEDAHHTLIIGATGTGKSAFAKSLIWQQQKLGVRTIILDPKDEYSELCKTLNGVEIDASKEQGINLFDLDQYKTMIDVNDLFRQLLEVLTGVELNNAQQLALNNILHEAKNSTKDSFKTFLDLVKKSKVLSEFASALENENLVKMLNSNKNKQSKIADSDLIRFSFSQVNKSELSLFVMIVARIISTLPIDNLKPTVLVIDEAFKFLSNTKSQNQVMQWFRILRSFNISVWCIEQDAREYGLTAETLYSQCNHIFLFKHEPIKQITIPSELYNEVKNFNAKSRNYLYVDKVENSVQIITSTLADNIKQYV